MKYIANPVEVDAYKIVEIPEPPTARGQLLKIDARPGDPEPLLVNATPDMMSRMKPSVGDYWVIQSDGYIYLNPKEVFERKYSPKSNA